MMPNPQADEYWRELKERAKEFGWNRINEKEFRINLLLAEIEDLQHQIDLLRAETDNDEPE